MRHRLLRRAMPLPPPPPPRTPGVAGGRLFSSLPPPPPLQSRRYRAPALPSARELSDPVVVLTFETLAFERSQFRW